MKDKPGIDPRIITGPDRDFSAPKPRLAFDVWWDSVKLPEEHRTTARRAWDACVNELCWDDDET